MASSPAGTYRVQTVEVTLDNLSFLAYRRVSTTIELPRVGRREREKAGGDHRSPRARRSLEERWSARSRAAGKLQTKSCKFYTIGNCRRSSASPQTKSHEGDE
jgi:hypothetical protein